MVWYGENADMLVALVKERLQVRCWHVPWYPCVPVLCPPPRVCVLEEMNVWWRFGGESRFVCLGERRFVVPGCGGAGGAGS